MESLNRRTPRRIQDEHGRIRLVDIVFLTVIVGAIFFVDWESVKEELSFYTMGSQKVALTNLECEIKEGRLLPNGIPGAPSASISGSVKNVGEEPLKLSVRIDYITKGDLANYKLPGNRMERVQPRPLAQNATGRFAFEEQVDRYFIGTDCQVQFREDDRERWIAFDDRTK